MKFTNALTDVKVRNAKPKAKDYKLADGSGLYLLVKTTGSKYWRYNYRFDGWKTLAVGVYPAMSLKEARATHEKATELVNRNVDPMKVKKAETEECALRATFRTVAADWLTTIVPADKRSGKSSARDQRNVRYLNAALGDIPMADLRVKHLADVLAKFEEEGKFETRVRVQGTARSVAGFAVGRGIVDVNPFSEVKFAAAFTAPANTPRPAIVDPEAFGHLLRKMKHFEGRDGNLTGYALELQTLCWPRPGDTAQAQWAHIDFNAAKWSVPFDELKMRTLRKKTGSALVDMPHDIPLSRQALTLLRSLYAITGTGRYLFPGRQNARTMSENTMNNALKAMGYEGTHCAHGFRSSASTILNKQRLEGRRMFDRDMIEIQLDHDDDSTRAIYDRDGLWEERVVLMQHWADLIDAMRTGKDPLKKVPYLVAVA